MFVSVGVSIVKGGFSFRTSREREWICSLFFSAPSGLVAMHKTLSIYGKDRFKSGTKCQKRRVLYPIGRHRQRTEILQILFQGQSGFLQLRRPLRKQFFQVFCTEFQDFWSEKVNRHLLRWFANFWR